jgi:ATP-binding cassette subfamily C protein
MCQTTSDNGRGARDRDKCGNVDWPVLTRFARRYRGHLAMVALTSVLINVLVFAGSAYLLLVYDAVLPSRSVPTLVALFALLLLVYLFQAVFEAIRAEALLGLANGVHDDLFDAVHHATVIRPQPAGADRDDGLQPMRDLDAIHGFLAGSGPVALIDLPWVVLFMIVLLALHVWLGLTALAGTLVMALLALWSNRRTQAGSRTLASVTGRRAAAALAQIRCADVVQAMGMRDRLATRSRAWEHEFVAAQAGLARTLARLGGASRTFRMVLQSLILTVGALLVIDGQASGGVILASSVLSGRALAPVDHALANWRALIAARAGWARMVADLATWQRAPRRSVTLEPPRAQLTIRDLWLAPPGTSRFVVQGISLTLTAGQVLALVGPSAAGKSSLARAMLGLWPAARGEVRLDGATLDQWDADGIGRHFGYVPQTVDLIEGTIGENIARFDRAAPSGAVIAAARAAGMHETILALPDGYDTYLTQGGGALSAGQRQRVGLARALYGDPFLLVLDEANANLDAAGDAALARAIDAVARRGGIVVMITHRPATLGPATHLAVMQHGRLVDFGDRDAVLHRIGGETARPARPDRAA